jgi:hypothetical protein
MENFLKNLALSVIYLANFFFLVFCVMFFTELDRRILPPVLYNLVDFRFFLSMVTACGLICVYNNNQKFGFLVLLITLLSSLFIYNYAPKVSIFFSLLLFFGAGCCFGYLLSYINKIAKNHSKKSARPE